MTDPAIDLAGLTFAWPAQPPLLDIPSLRVARGERVLLQGPSGSGKSTLLGLLGGVLVPGRGSVRILGTDLRALGATQRDAFRADHIGIVFQQFNLLPFLSALENVTLACRFSARRTQRAGNAAAEARRLIAALGLDPDALGTRSARELSGRTAAPRPAEHRGRARPS